MRILDLFCGAGGAALGYARAGFEVVGVDIAPQRRFPFAFLQADALSLDLRFLRFFDAIHASPPCQGYSPMRHAPGAKKDHPLLIGPTRAMLQATGLPFVIENVEDARPFMVDPVMLCGSHFGLGAAGFQLRRHRLFEASFPIPQPACAHDGPAIGVYGGHVRLRAASAGGRGTVDFVGHDRPALAREAMGYPANHGITMGEISESIPPAYAEHVAAALLRHLESSR